MSTKKTERSASAFVLETDKSTGSRFFSMLEQQLAPGRSMSSYLVPDLAPNAYFRLEETIQRSRFIVSVAHTPGSAKARVFVESIRREFPDATHNCWAFAAGAPGATAHVGYSDDGEPHGTAGRPMLTMLLHGGIGEICAVVTRYFGGVKLGTGGLVRAYQGVVRLGLENVPRRLYMPPALLEVVVAYSHITPLQRLLPAFSAAVEAERFEADATFRINLPASRADDFTVALTELTEGAVLVHTLDAANPTSNEEESV